MERKKLDLPPMTPEELEYHKRKFLAEMRLRRIWKEEKEAKQKTRKEIDIDSEFVEEQKTED